MWTYHQRSGALWHDGRLIATGYSGKGDFKNRPDKQAVPELGPIPAGRYRIGAPYNSVNVGPFALPLTPLPGTNTFGRGDFRIHGDKIGDLGNASKGCIILARAIRALIARSGDDLLEVVA